MHFIARDDMARTQTISEALGMERGGFLLIASTHRLCSLQIVVIAEKE